jgi:hypothetical protein
VRCGNQSIVGLQFDHRPDGDAHGAERVLQRLELRQQRWLDTFARLVARPQAVAERLDDMVGGHPDVRLAALDELEHGLEDANHRAERTVLPVVEAAQAVEVSEQLVRAVDEMYDFSAGRLLRSAWQPAPDRSLSPHVHRHSMELIGWSIFSNRVRHFRASCLATRSETLGN